MRRLVVAVTVAVAISASGAAQELPRPVQAFYQAWNFVVANSRPMERNRLWSLHDETTTGSMTTAEKEILERMIHIANATEETASAMPTKHRARIPVRSEMLTVLSFEWESESSVLLTVAASEYPPARSRSVQADDWPTQPADSDRSRLRASGQFRHRWIFRDGEWRVLQSPAVRISGRNL